MEKILLLSFPEEPVPLNLGLLGKNTLSLYTVRGEESYPMQDEPEKKSHAANILSNNLSLSRGFSNLNRGGRYIIVGYDPQKPLPINVLDMHYNEWQLIGSRVSTKLELEEVIQLVERKKIIPVIDKILPIREANQALKEIAEGKVIGRVVLDHLI